MKKAYVVLPVALALALLLAVSPLLIGADGWKVVKVTTTTGGIVKCTVQKGQYSYVHWIGEHDSEVFWAIAGSKLTCEPYPKLGYEFDEWGDPRRSAGE